MNPRSEQGTMHGYSANHATGHHPNVCGDIYAWATGTYARDRMADYNLHCTVGLLRVHVRNSNKLCDGSNRCALKKFDVLGEETNPTWAYLGRFTMPDPGTTVRSPIHTTSKPNDPRTVLICHLRRLTSTWMGTGSLTRRSTSGSWRDVTKLVMGRRWNRTTMRALLSARSSLKPLSVSWR